MEPKPAERALTVNMQSPSPETPSGKNLRIHARARIRLPGKIVFGSRSFALDCTIRDLSASGARISVPNPNDLPNQLVLIEPKNDLAFNAKIEWRRSNLVGLSFESAISLAGGLEGEHQLLRMHAAAAKREWKL
jgi:hypothetical protein